MSFFFRNNLECVSVLVLYDNYEMNLVEWQEYAYIVCSIGFRIYFSISTNLKKKHSSVLSYPPYGKHNVVGKMGPFLAIKNNILTQNGCTLWALAIPIL